MNRSLNMLKQREPCGLATTLWTQCEPRSSRVYRVECYSEGHFFKWGTDKQLEEAKKRD